MKYSSNQVDLHTHSNFSDGVLTPAQVAKLASKNGVKLWSLTDHDGIDGQLQAIESAKENNLDYLTGLELTCSFANRNIHLIGLGIDLENQLLKDELTALQQQRLQRAQAMADNLANLGIKNAMAGAQALAINPKLIARPHFAQFLVNQGICPDMHTAFKKYLDDKQKSYVQLKTLSLAQAVELIEQAQGMAVLAHPSRYRLHSMEELALLESFHAMGGKAIEVAYKNHSSDEMKKYASIALNYNFYASRGSDFHGSEHTEHKPNSAPELAKTLTPVWEMLDERILR